MISILFPVNELRIGGAEQQLLELVRGLDKSRFRPIVAPLYPNGALAAEFCGVPGVEVVDLDRRGKYDFSTLLRMTRLLRARRIDVVQPFLSPSTFFGLLPAIVARTPVKIVTERCGARRVRRLGYHAYRLAEDRLAHFADAVVPNSAAGRDLLLSRGIDPAKLHVIYNGINPDRLGVDRAQAQQYRQQLGAGSHGPVITILASLTRPKGHETLLHAASLLKRELPHARYAIVGDGPLRPALEALTQSLGVAERVIFFGYQRRVADFLGASDLLVSASRDNEGCSNSILEAMGLGVPVIATDIGGNRELVEDDVTGYLVAPDDSEALAGAIRRVVSNVDGSRCLTMRAQHLVETRFSLHGMVREYEALYTRLLRFASARDPGRLSAVGRAH